MNWISEFQAKERAYSGWYFEPDKRDRRLLARARKEIKAKFCHGCDTLKLNCLSDRCEIHKIIKLLGGRP